MLTWRPYGRHSKFNVTSLICLYQTLMTSAMGTGYLIRSKTTYLAWINNYDVNNAACHLVVITRTVMPATYLVVQVTTSHLKMKSTRTISPNDFTGSNLEMDMEFHSTLYNECNYLSMPWLKLIHISKGPLLWLVRYVITSIIECGMKLFIHSQNSTLKFQHG